MTSVPEFTSLVTLGYWMNFHDNSDLTAFPPFPALVNIQNGGISAYSNPNMTTVGTFLPSIKYIESDVNFEACALDQASVDAVLAKLVSLDGTNGTTLWQYRNVYLHNGTNAYPSEAGLESITILQGRGCNVYYNSP